MGERDGAVILSAVRLPTGRFLGALKDFSAPELGALVIREAVRRAGLDAALVEQCYMGNVVSAGLGQAPARQAALRGGLSDDVSAVTVNQVCGSGLRAVMRRRTSVIVAHRISTVRHADQILVLDQGRIAERGTHAELIRQHGLYAAMHNKQLLEEELAAS